MGYQRCPWKKLAKPFSTKRESTMRLLWLCFPAVLGWDFEGINMFHQGNQDIESFKDFIFPMASHIVQEINTSKGISTAHHGSKSAGKYLESGNKADNKHNTDHDKENGSKGHSDKETHKKRYGEEFKNQEKYDSEEEDGNEHHSSKGGMKEGFFKDRLLHKSGNYEKGYRDQYHMDEVKKQDKFWSNHDSFDNFHKFGDSQAGFQHRNKSKHSDDQLKQGKEEENKGKKGTSGGGHSMKEDKGHQSTGGTESKYEHKEKYAKKSEDKT